MQPPNKVAAAEVGQDQGSGGKTQTKRCNNEFNKIDSPFQQLIADLEALADWRDNLLRRIERRYRYLEYVNAWAGIDDLAIEVRAFGECCRDLSEKIGAQNCVFNRRAA